jgi:hypothetical protein
MLRLSFGLSLCCMVCVAILPAQAPRCATVCHPKASKRAAMTPAEFTAFIRRDIARWAPLAKRLMQAGAPK